MQLLKAISRTPLFKATSLNSVGILLKIGIGLITSKILAVFIGPGGLALVGNLRNFMTTVESISTLGFQTGVIKYVADHKNDEAELKKIISTVFFSLLGVTLLLSVLLFAFSGVLNEAIFGSDLQYAVIFKILALVLPWYAVTVLLIAVINGLGRYKSVIYINIAGNIIGLLFSVFVVWKYETFGALLSIIVPPSLLFFVVFYFLNKQLRFANTISWSVFDFGIIKKMASYTLMAAVSSVLGPMVFLAIRNNAIESLGVDQAGYWEAMNRISTYYIMFVSTILTVYFLPKLAWAETKKQSRAVFLSYYKSIFPLFVIGLVVLYFLRFYIVQLLFTPEFLPVAGLFFWQLLGDVFKAASLILGYQFFAQKLTAAFIITELLSLSITYFLSKYLIGIYQIEGLVIAHAITYFVYLLVLVIYFRKQIF